LWHLEFADFAIGEDENGYYVEYHERYSKNHKASLSKFQPEHFRPSVKVYDLDVYDTFQRYAARHPEGMANFFLQPIDSPRDAWYAKTPMGLKQVCSLVKQIFSETGLDPEGYTNESSRFANGCTRSSNGRWDADDRFISSLIPFVLDFLFSTVSSDIFDCVCRTQQPQ
jgi:hypothetical protein